MTTNRSMSNFSFKTNDLISIQEVRKRDFPGGPVVKTPQFQCRGLRFHPWWGNYDSINHAAQSPRKKTKNLFLKMKKKKK